MNKKEKKIKKEIVSCGNCNCGNRWYNGIWVGLPAIFIPIFPVKKVFNIEDPKCFDCPECGCTALRLLERN